jgi:hypothetical protein
MNQISDADLAEVFGVLSFLVVPIPAAVAAFLLERKRRKRMPGTRAYTWGIYLGLSTLLAGLLFLGLFVASKPQSWAWDGGFAVASVVAGFGAMRRYRFGLIGSVLLSLNPIWWVVGSPYIENRWAELSENTHGGSLAWFRVGWRVLALLGAACVAWASWFTQLFYSAFDTAVSVSSAVISVFAVRHFFLKPRGYPLVWYVTLLTSLVVCFPVRQRLAEGFYIGSVMALLVFAARGRVPDPWVSTGTLRHLWTRARSWPYNPNDEPAP